MIFVRTSFPLVGWLLFHCLATTFSGSHGSKFTIIQTTDVHGWINGHPHDKELNARFGEFLSLVQRMRQKASQFTKEEVLLFDSGDIIDGSGISDATPVHGQYVIQLFKQFGEYDGMTMGNHDLERNSSLEYFKESLIPAMGKRYVTTNSFWKDTHKRLGANFNVIETPMGHRVLVLGFLFNFTKSETAYVVSVEETFANGGRDIREAMTQSHIDIVVVMAHIDPHSPTIHYIRSHIRKFYEYQPLVILAGHMHIKMHKQLDDSCWLLSSGRFFQTIGLLQFNYTRRRPEIMSDVKVRYVKTNVTQFHLLSHTTPDTFWTNRGKKLQHTIASMEDRLGLYSILGCSPMTYDPHAPYNDSSSFYKLFLEKMVTHYFSDHPSDSSETPNPRIMMRITREDLFEVSPFQNPIQVLSRIPRRYMKRLLEVFQGKHGRNTDLRPHYYVSDVKLGDFNDIFCTQYDCKDVSRELDILDRNLTFSHQALFINPVW